MTGSGCISMLPADAAPALPDAVRQHLGQLLAAAYAPIDREPSTPERFTALLACGFRRKPATHSEAKPASVPI